MACSDSLNQLLVLLWKSWKTLIRSKKWLAAQGMLAIIIWVTVFFLLKKMKGGSPQGVPDDLIVKDKKNISYYGDSEWDQIHSLDYKCINKEGYECSKEINETMDHVCDEIVADAQNRPNSIDKGKCKFTAGIGVDLAIREFNRSSVSIDYYNRWDRCHPPITTTAQFMGQDRPCEAALKFRFIAKQAGIMDKLTIQHFDVPDLQTNYGPLTTLLLPLSCGLSLVFFCAQVTLEVSQEAQSLIKDYLLSVGMSRILYFSHHIIFHFVKSWIVVIGLAVIFGYFYKSVAFAFSVLLIVSLVLAAWISMSIMIGTCFKKPGIGAFVTVLVLLVFTALAQIMKLRRNSPTCLLVCLIPNFALQFIIDAKFEGDVRGVTLSFEEASEALTQGYFFLMLIFDILFYFFLAILIDFLRSSFENPISLLRGRKSIVEEENKSLIENREKSDQQTNADVVIEGVHKMYSTGEHAVRGINMKIYKGQVTALLGHNGAGKSTTFSMISGMTVPTRGKIQIMDTESKEGRQKLIGYCPQYNAIFSKLTVDEHLYFFAKLKGVDSTNGDSVLAALGMSDKGSARAINLSGGMKRKLCIAIAFAADSPIILLDEPTAGMDTGARRDFERLLLEKKKEHTILLTTHYTDEAEMLADKIIIMARGKVFCSGSAQFLRKKFDSGFILCFAVEKETETDNVLEEMMKIVKEFVPDSSVSKKRSKQFELKLSTTDTTRFCEMFRKIEEVGHESGLQSYGLSVNKLEQVFLKVGEMTGTVDRSEEVQTAMKELIKENEKRADGAGKVIKQIGNTLLKRLHFDIAHIGSLIFMLVALFGATLLIMRGFLRAIDKGESRATDLLEIHDPYRIGIDSSLHDNYAQINSISKLFGDYLTIHKAESILDWYKAQSHNRPPILGGLSRNGKEWTVYIRKGHELYLPSLLTIAAMVNNEELKKVEFNHAEEKGELDDSMKQLIGMYEKDINGNNKQQFFRYFLPLLTPLMFIRPIAFLITERVSNFGHQQRLTGISRVITVLTSIVYDIFLYFLHVPFFLASIFVGRKTFFKENYGLLISVPLVGFVSSEMMLILLSRMFATPGMGQIAILFILICCPVLVIMLEMAIDHVAPGMSPFYVLSPMCTYGENELGKLGPIKATAFFVVHFLILILVFVFIEFGLIAMCRRRKNQPPVNDDESKAPGDALVLRVDNLQKWYGSKKKRVYAVKGITFGVHSHECFGVLGINGAGKTSTFEVLTGNALPDEGSATVGGVDCSTPATIGYCPQMDALIEDLTGRQSLIILAALHGYDNPRYVADIVITCVGMQEHADKRSKTYSGGQRRKISVAASLLAQNSLIILDEPTAGIDPIARRDIWSVICALRESTNTAIVLTSHSMDEVEALVSNLIILREGSIIVEGSPQMIKNKYGDHYNFNLVIDNVTDVGQITTQVLSVFPNASLYDSASLRNIKYHITRHSSDIFSEIFEKASIIAKELNATDFCFTQATLEDAFMLAATAKPEADVVPAIGFSTTSVEQNEPKMAEITATAGEMTATAGGTTSTRTLTKTNKEV